MEEMYKSKQKKYAHVESKVKQYIVELNLQHDESKKRRLIEEQKIREELNNVALLEDVKIKEENQKCECLAQNVEPLNAITLKEVLLNNNESITEQAIAHDLDKFELNTPGFSNERKSNNPHSLIKTCLFKQSPAFRPQILMSTPRLSIYEGNSTCRTIDVQDFNEEVFSPKIVTPISDISGRSDAPLFKVTHKSNNTEQKYGIRKFIGKFLNCPKFLKYKRSTGKALFKNKIYPDYEIPQVVIECCDAMELDNDSGNQSNLPSSRIKNKNYRQSKTTLNHIHLSPNQELQLEELVQCADELTYKVNEFKFFAQELLTNNNDLLQ